MTYSRKSISIGGSLTGLPPLLKHGKESGKPWCRFHIDVKGILHGVTAFGENAERICAAQLQVGTKLSVKGSWRDQDAKEVLADIILLPGDGEAIETTEGRIARYWGSKAGRDEAFRRELEYQAHYGRTLAYDAEGRKWFWPADDVVMYNGKPYIKLEAQFLSEGR